MKLSITNPFVILINEHIKEKGNRNTLLNLTQSNIARPHKKSQISLDSSNHISTRTFDPSRKIF